MIESMRDRGVALPDCDQLQHLSLPVGQRGKAPRKWSEAVAAREVA